MSRKDTRPAAGRAGIHAAIELGVNELHDAIDLQIARENNLINCRLGWTLQGNGFMFTALALLASKGGADARMITLLNDLLPFAGLAISAAGLLGVIAAQCQQNYLARCWERQLSQEACPRPFGERRYTYILGIAPSVLPPAVLIAVWTALLLR